MEANLLPVLRQELARRGFRELTRPYELNLVAIRKPGAGAGEFSDELHVFYADDAGRITYAVLPCTTDVATWAGAARAPYALDVQLLAEGQYPDALHVHLDMLEQVGPMTFLERYDRGAPLGLSVGVEQLHAGAQESRRVLFAPADAPRMRAVYEPTGEALRRIQGWQVLRSPRDWEWLLKVAHEHARRYGQLTYTLLDARTHRVATLRRWGRTALVGVGIAGAFLGTVRTLIRQLPDGTEHSPE